MRDQPEYIYNINIMYDLDSTGTSFGFFCNVVGQTLKKGPSLSDNYSYPAVYSKSHPEINVSISQKIGRGKLTFRAKNINDAEIEEFYRYPDPDNEGEHIDDTKTFYQKGISYSVSFGMKW